jgi:hypothetical protein
MPLLVHASAHVFVGFGPDLTHDLSRSITFPTVPTAPPQQNRFSEVAGTLIVGGWI